MPVQPVDVREVAAVVRVPVAELADPANRLRVRHPSGWVGPAFAVRGLLVWGFTAGLVDTLLRLGGWERPWDRRTDPTELPPSSDRAEAETALPDAVFDLLDGVLLVAVVLFGISGYRQGFVIGALSFIGFLGGAVLGREAGASDRNLLGKADVAGARHRRRLPGRVPRPAGRARRWRPPVRTRIHWRPAQTVDSVGGAIVSGISVLLVAWLMASAVNRSPFEALRRQVRNSAIIVSVDALVPDIVRDCSTTSCAWWRSRASRRCSPGWAARASSRSSPRTRRWPTAPRSATSSRASLKITGGGAVLRKVIEGSGFVYAPQHIMTNAHVVAGVPNPHVELNGTRSPPRAWSSTRSGTSPCSTCRGLRANGR